MLYKDTKCVTVQISNIEQGIMNSEVLTVKILFFLFVIKLCCSAPIREIPHFVRNDNVIGYYEGKAWRPYRICKA